MCCPGMVKSVARVRMPLFAYFAITAPVLMVGLHVTGSALDSPEPLAYSRAGPTLHHPTAESRAAVPVLTSRQGVAPPASAIAQAEGVESPQHSGGTAQAAVPHPRDSRAEPMRANVRNARDQQAYEAHQQLARAPIDDRSRDRRNVGRQSQSEVLSQFGPPRGGGRQRGSYAYDQIHRIY